MCVNMWKTSFVFVLLLFFMLIITHRHAANYTIIGCSNDGYINVREDTGTKVTCEDIPDYSYSIYWALSGNRIGNCGYPNDNNYCWLIGPDKADYKLSRPSPSRSELEILGNFRSKASETILCSLRSNGSQTSCTLNVVYPGRPTHPTLSTDGVTWTVSGSMRVEKVYSSRNKYSCIWIQESETQHEMNKEIVEPDLSIFLESDQEFYNGTCSFSWPLPTEEGRYAINLKVVPGETDKSYSAGTIDIEHPGDPEIHCDDGPVVEKSDITCQCRPSSRKTGSPAPSLSWPGFSHSSQIRLTNIRREDNGTQYTCQLTWGPNANIVRTASYKLHLDIYGPSRAYINSTELSASHTGCLVCRAEDVHPSANFNWTGINCNYITHFVNSTTGTVKSMQPGVNESVNESVCVFTPSREDYEKEVTCTATNTYTGTLFTSASWRIELSLPETESESQQFLGAAVGGGVGGFIAAIVIVIVIVLVIVRRKKRKKTYERPKERRNEDTHPYMDLTPSVTASTSEVSHPVYNEINFAMGQTSTQGPDMNTYEQPSPRRNEDAYLYTDLSPSVTPNNPDYATRDYKGKNIGAGQGFTEELETNTYEQQSPRRNEDTYLYMDLTRSVTSSAHSDVTRAPNDVARDYDDINIATGPDSIEISIVCTLQM